MARSTLVDSEVLTAPAPAAADPLPVVDHALLVKQAQSETVCTRFALYAAAGGVIPVPFLDLAAITALQVRMIEVLCKIHDKPFNEQTAKIAIGTVVSTFGVYPVASRYIASGLKLIPGIGQLLGATAGPAIAGGLTYALGKMFSRHFETGGSLLNIDLGDAKAAFNEYYEKGKKLVGTTASTLKKPFDVPAPTASA
jgi:uncharacterized protein (DUF697 family)